MFPFWIDFEVTSIGEILTLATAAYLWLGSLSMGQSRPV